MGTQKSKIVSFWPRPRHTLEFLERGKDVVRTWSSVDVTLILSCLRKHLKNNNDIFDASNFDCFLLK